MAVDTTITDPAASLDRATGDLITETHWDQTQSNVNRLLGDSTTQTLAANKTLSSADPAQQFLDPGGADRTITLPLRQDLLWYEIHNMADAGAEALRINDSSGTELGAIYQNEMAYVRSSTAQWRMYRVNPVAGGGQTTAAISLLPDAILGTSAAPSGTSDTYGSWFSLGAVGTTPRVITLVGHLRTGAQAGNHEAQIGEGTATNSATAVITLPVGIALAGVGVGHEPSDARLAKAPAEVRVVPLSD